jgi:hypothetical protein
MVIKNYVTSYTYYEQISARYINQYFIKLLESKSKIPTDLYTGRRQQFYINKKMVNSINMLSRHAGISFIEFLINKLQSYLPAIRSLKSEL